MIRDPQIPKYLISDNGKIARQLSSDIILGTEVWLRKVIINGVQIDDFVENYEENRYTRI